MGRALTKIVINVRRVKRASASLLVRSVLRGPNNATYQEGTENQKINA
jgi:hypothetical protein